jgi:hypothetical protein
MPGLGDSPGHQLNSVRDVWAFTEQGGHAKHAAALVEQLNERFGFTGMIVGGLCGGAITSIFAADALTRGIAGLVLLEPAYYRVGAEGSQMPGKSPLSKSGSGKNNAGLLSSLRAEIKSKSNKGWWKWARSGYVFAGQVRDVLIGPKFPEGINHSLVDASRRVAGRQLPLLLVTAGKSQRWLNRFQVFGRVPGRQITFVEIEGTNHMLVPGGGKSQVIENVNSWLVKTFTERPQA